MSVRPIGRYTAKEVEEILTDPRTCDSFIAQHIRLALAVEDLKKEMARTPLIRFMMRLLGLYGGE